MTNKKICAAGVQNRGNYMNYGYCYLSNKYQVSSAQQSLILSSFKDAVIEVAEGRDESVFTEMLKSLKDGDLFIVTDLIKLFNYGDFSDYTFDTVFDTVFTNYQKVFSTGADLVILSSPTLSSSIFRKAIMRNIAKGSSSTEMAVSEILEEQIRIILKGETEKETLRRTGIGNGSGKRPSRKGIKLVIKKQKPCKDFIKNNLLDFGGTLTNDEVIKELGIARNTFFKYKKELLSEFPELRRDKGEIDRLTFDTKSDTDNKEKKKASKKPLNSDLEVNTDKSPKSPVKPEIKAPEKSQRVKKNSSARKKDMDGDQIEGQTSLFDFL